MRQSLDDLNQRLRYVLGEYDEPPESMPLPSNSPRHERVDAHATCREVTASGSSPLSLFGLGRTNRGVWA